MFYSLADYYPAQAIGQFRSTQGSPKEIKHLVKSGCLPSICHSSVTLNVSKARSLGGYRFNLHVEDIDLWWRMALQYDICLIPEATVGFRQHPQSVSSANLQTQALNTLYIQYLLLSHLWQRRPLRYEEACGPLSRLYSGRRLKFKKHARASNMEFGRGKILRGLRHAACALLASPTHFTQRVLDEIAPGRLLGLGDPPNCFAQMESILWPAGSGSAETANAYPECPDTDAPARPLAERVL